MNVVKKYFKTKDCGTKEAMAKHLKMNNQQLIQKMIHGTAIPEARKLDVYLYVYSDLPVKAQTYIIDDLTKILREKENLITKLKNALFEWQ